jgi:hypothetical protein
MLGNNSDVVKMPKTPPKSGENDAEARRNWCCLLAEPVRQPMRKDVRLERIEPIEI